MGKGSAKVEDVGSESDSEDETGPPPNLIEVKVIEAVDVIAADRGGTSDPYAILDFKGIQKKTAVVKKSLTPKWNETFQFEICKPSGYLVIDLFDHDISLFGTHDFLGRVEVDLSTLTMEAVFEEWLDLQPREGKLEIVSGKLHIHIIIMPKDRSVEDKTGLDAFPWLDRSLYRAKGHVRTTNVMRVYFASTFADFEEEFKAMHSKVFPKLESHCQTQGYHFVPVVMRLGLDERLDLVYMNDGRIRPIVFREIAECRRISPRANFFAFLGERYGTAFLPASLDKNEYMAICGTLMEDDEDDMALLALFQKWYKLDENQIPTRMLLQNTVDGISPSAGLGSEQHNEWVRVERKMFDGLRSITQKTLGPNRLWKYKVSLLEQEIILGALLPEDSAEHVTCVLRTISALRVANVKAARFVDIIHRRGESGTDVNLKEVEPKMIDEEKRGMMKDLKSLLVQKLGNHDVGGRCIQILSSWQGWTNGTDHIPELCGLIYDALLKVFVSEISKYPRYGFAREEVLLHRRSQLVTQKVLKKGSKTADLPKGEHPAFDAIRAYLNTNSDNTLPPLIVRGPPGSGMTSVLSLAASWCKEKMLPGAVTVHRQCGLTPDSTNGCMLIWLLVKQLSIAYLAAKNVKLQMNLTVVKACDLPAADRGGTSDPFVQIKLAKHKVRTKTIKKTLNPEWNENYEMKDLLLTDKMVVTVWDYDVIGKNDLLGQVEIPLSKIQLNTPCEKWYEVPMEFAEEKEPPVVIFFDVVIMEAKNLRPQSFRMDLDPFVRLTLGSSSVQTTHREDSQDPEYNEKFEITLEDTGDQVLKFAVWDKGDDKGTWEDGLIAEGEFDLNEIAIEATHEGWIDLKKKTEKGDIPAGSLRFAATRHQETLEMEEVEVTEGPRILLHITLIPMPTNVDKALDKTQMDIPCMYLQLAERFRETLLFASASKPINIILDGFDSIPSSDPTTTMLWIPEKLPRYVHIIVGFRDVECKALDVLLNRDTVPRIVKVKLQDPETGREALSAAIISQVPKRTLTGPQRSSLLASFTSKTVASGLGQVLEIACNIPSYDSPIAADKIETAFKEIIRVRCSYLLNNRVDTFKLWRAMDYIALAPLGVTESELRQLMSGGTLGPLPDICFSEIMTVLEPLLRERTVDGHVVIQFKYEFYSDLVIKQRFPKRAEAQQIRDEMLSQMQNLPDFNEGGKIHMRRLRCVPLLLKAGGKVAMAKMDDFLTDMHILEMRLCSNMIFDVFLNLIEHGPGIGGKAGDLLGLLEEYGVLLTSRPRMLLQLALNMPDHTGVYVQGRYLEMRRRRGHFFVISQTTGVPGQETIQEKLKRQQNERLAAMGDRDLALGHPDAIEWRRAQTWIKWLNKPQTRGQCKKVLKGHKGSTYGATYICNGLVILSISGDRTIKAYSPFTGEILKEIGEHPKGIIIMELSPDLKWLATGSEEGTVIIWELDAGPPPTAGAFAKLGGMGDEGEEPEEERGDGVSGEGEGKRFSDTDMKDTTSVRYPQERLRIKPFSKRITGIAFTPGDTITISADETDVKIFEIRGDGQRELNSFVPFRYNISKLAATPDDAPTQMIAIAGRNSVKLYRYETLDFRGGLHGHERTVNDVKFSSNGRDDLMIATVSNDLSLKVWQQAGPREWHVMCDLKSHSDCVRSVAWAPDDQSILTGAVDRTVKVWAIVPEKFEDEESKVDDNEETTFVPVFAEKRPSFVSAKNTTKKVFKLLATFDGHADTLTNVRFHPQGTLALTCSRDKEVRVYDTRVPYSTVEPASHSSPIKIVTAAKSKNKEGKDFLASVDYAGMVKIWDCQSGEPVLWHAVDTLHTFPVTAMSFTNSVQYLITASKDGSIKRWDLGRFAEEFAEALLSAEAKKRLEARRKKEKREENPLKFKAHKGGVSVLMMHHQGDFFLTSGFQEPKITIWDAETMLDVQSFETQQDSKVLHATFSIDGKFVISADSSNKFRLWNIEGNKEVFNCSIDSTDVMQSVDFSSDGRYIGTVAVEAKQIGIWDASQGLTKQGSLQGHAASVIQTSFSFDGRYVCSIAQDKTVIVWILKECKSLAILLLDHIPSCLSVGHTWPRFVVGDSTGHVYLMQVVFPTPLDFDEEGAVTESRLAIQSPTSAAKKHGFSSPMSKNNKHL